jgi:hypothetical protein
MNAIVTRLLEALGRRKPATAAASEQLLAAQLNRGDQDRLRDELERILAGRDQLGQYLRELEGRLDRPAPPSDPFADEVLAQVSQNGLKVLSPGQLGRLAVSPPLLLALWDAIDDDGLSPYWLEVVRSSMRAEEERRGSKFPTVQEMAARARRAAPLVRAAAGQDLDQRPAPLSAPKRWEKEVRLSQAEWLSRDNPATVTPLEAQSIGLEFSWLTGERPSLEVRFSRGPLALPGGGCTAALIDRHGKEFPASGEGADCLVFGNLPSGGLEALAGARFVCCYSMPGSFQLKVAVPVDPELAEND